MEKVKYNDYVEFLAEWFDGPMDTKLGQTFLNKFHPELESSHLFFQKDNFVAMQSILTEFVELPEEDTIPM